MIPDALSDYPDADDVLSRVMDALAALWVADLDALAKATKLAVSAIRDALKVAIDLGCVSANVVHGMTVYSLAD